MPNAAEMPAIRIMFLQFVLAARKDIELTRIIVKTYEEDYRPYDLESLMGSQS
jgi:hypothetical protein